MAAGIVAHQLALALNGISQLREWDDLVVELDGWDTIDDMSLSIDRTSDEEIDESRLATLLQLGALRNLITHTRSDITHVGDKHEEEKHGEDEIGHGGEIQSWHLTLASMAETGHG